LNPRYGCPYAAFRVRCDRPLCHLSGAVFRASCGKVESAGGRKIDAARRPEGMGSGGRPAARKPLSTRAGVRFARGPGLPHLPSPTASHPLPPPEQAAGLRFRLRLACAWQVARRRARMTARTAYESGQNRVPAPLRGFSLSRQWARRRDDPGESGVYSGQTDIVAGRSHSQLSPITRGQGAGRGHTVDHAHRDHKA
jgi:hypothetical protein